MPRKKKKPVEVYIIAALRKIWFYSELRQNAAKAVKEGSRYRCQMCNELHEKIQIDHIIPVGSAKNAYGDYDWNTFIDKLLYCTPENLQALCKECHSAKSAVDNKLIKKKKPVKKTSK